MRYHPIPRLTEKQLERFWARVQRRGPDECWLWTGPVSKNKPSRDHVQIYGVFRVDGLYLRPHRISYTLLVGPIPEDLSLDHVFGRCTSTLCCNPAHTEPVTLGVNAQRYYRSRTHCKRGHPIEQHGRPCRPCRTLGKQRERLRKKQTDRIAAD